MSTSAEIILAEVNSPKRPTKTSAVILFAGDGAAVIEASAPQRESKQSIHKESILQDLRGGMICKDVAAKYSVSYSVVRDLAVGAGIPLPRKSKTKRSTAKEDPQLVSVKATALEDLRSGMMRKDVAEKYGLSRSLVSNWALDSEIPLTPKDHSVLVAEAVRRLGQGEPLKKLAGGFKMSRYFLYLLIKRATGKIPSEFYVKPAKVKKPRKAHPAKAALLADLQNGMPCVDASIKHRVTYQTAVAWGKEAKIPVTNERRQAVKVAALVDLHAGMLYSDVAAKHSVSYQAIYNWAREEGIKRRICKHKCKDFC